MSVYLDNNATTPLHPAVAAAMQECLAKLAGNPASQHHAGRQARRMLEQAREAVAARIGARTHGMDADRLIFTSGGTEANNLAVRGLAGRRPRHVVISSIEHPSVEQSALALAERGCRVTRLPVDSQGRVDADCWEDSLPAEPQLVSVMLVNHETGVMQPVPEIAGSCRQRGWLLHTDAVQAVGKIPVDFTALGVDALSLSGHKFHGPVGVGCLVLRHDVPCHPILFGGFQQAGLRPGSEPVVLAVGLQRALELWQDELQERQQRLRQLRDDFEQRLQERCPRVQIHGRAAPPAPHTSCISFPGTNRQAFLMALDLAGIACSTGSACASGSSEPSPVLQAMGVDTAALESALRFSLGAQTTPRDIAWSVDVISLKYNDLTRLDQPR